MGMKAKFAGVLTAAALAATASASHALTITFDDGTNPAFTVTDQDANDFFGGAGGVDRIGYFGFSSGAAPAAGAWAIGISTAIAADGSLVASLDSDATVSSPGAGTLTITVEHLGYSNFQVPPNIGNYRIDHNIDLADPSVATLTTDIDQNGGADSYVNLATLDADELTQDQIVFGTLNPFFDGEFDLRQTTVITVAGKRTIETGSTIEISPIPVPAALPLFASALIGLGLLGRRRRSA